MKTIETSIIIESSATEVWNTLMDFENYPTWNPFIQKINGMASVGANLEVHLSLDNNKPMVMKPKVMKSEAGHLFSWLGHLFVEGLFDGHHSFSIQENDDDSVTFIHREEFTGILAVPLLKLVGSKTRSGFVAMNKALKNKVENNTNYKKAS